MPRSPFISPSQNDFLCFAGIGIRVLIGQYLALRQPPVENYVGVICSVTSPYEIVKRAIDDAAFMCTRKYGDAPEVIMSGRLDLTFPYVPTHLRKLRRSKIGIDLKRFSHVRYTDQSMFLTVSIRLYHVGIAEEQYACDSGMARRRCRFPTHQSDYC